MKDKMENKVIEKRITEIYEFIIAYLKEHKYAPSYREIGMGVGLKSTSSVQDYITIMMERGMLETDAPHGIPRAFRVTGYEFTKAEEEELPPLAEPMYESPSIPNIPCVKSEGED